MCEGERKQNQRKDKAQEPILSSTKDKYRQKRHIGE